jgi:hypothetical protein
MHWLTLCTQLQMPFLPSQLKKTVYKNYILVHCCTEMIKTQKQRQSTICVKIQCHNSQDRSYNTKQTKIVI